MNVLKNTSNQKYTSWKTGTHIEAIKSNLMKNLF